MQLSTILWVFFVFLILSVLSRCSHPVITQLSSGQILINRLHQLSDPCFLIYKMESITILPHYYLR